MRVLVVGHGLIGRRRAAALVELSASTGASLAGTVDPTLRPPELHGGAPHFPSLDAVSPDVYDAAIIAVPHDRAPELALRVLALDKPVLVEKPLGRTTAEAERVADAAKRVRRPSFVGYNYRFLPHVREALVRAAAGRLGQLRSFDVLLGHGGHPRSAEGWKLDPVRAGGGVLLDPGVHLLDLVLCARPRARLQHVAATRGFWPTGVEEDAVVVLSDEHLLATVRVSHVRWVNTFRMELVGEDGYVLLEGRGENYGSLRLFAGRRWGWNDGTGRSQRETEEALSFGDGDTSLRDELAHVLAAWMDQTYADSGPPPASFDEALRVSRLCDTMYRALAGGKLASEAG